MPRCNMVKKGTSQRHEGPSPYSPTEASIAPPCYSPKEHSAHTEWCRAEYEELGVPLAERSAADKEAAHELLSLAHSLPPLPPTAIVTNSQPPEPVGPLYTYSIQPTNIYIVTDPLPEEQIYHAIQTVTPVQMVEYVHQQVNYVTYHTTDDDQREYVEETVHEYIEPVYAEMTAEMIEFEYVERGPEAEPGYEPNSDLKPEPEFEPKHHHEPEPEDVLYTTPPKPSGKKSKAAKHDCNKCGKRYATSSNLSRHKQTHRSLDSVAAKRCQQCGKAYVSMPALAMHVLTHRMGHVCGVCGKQFSRPWLLRGHLRSHTGEQPYRCGDCGKAFADRSNLRAHLQTHLIEKKYECGRCRKTFALKSYLNKHQELACMSSDDEID